MIIRKAKKEDINAIMNVYQAAQDFMIQNGNPNQWGRVHPPRDLIMKDIELGQSYVGVFDEAIHCVFALIEGQDPTYKRIVGAWLSNTPYSTVHRIASDGKYPGVFKQCMDYCKTQTNNIRIDTHEDNAIMHHVLQENGFIFCGTIFLPNGDPRLAYQYIQD